MRVILLFAISLGAVTPLCAVTDEDVMTKKALAPASDWDGATLFEPIPDDRSGVDLTYELDPEHPLKRLYAFGWATGNVAIGDLDGDDRADLFFPGTTGEHRIFIQREDFRFEDVSAIAQIRKEGGWASSATLVDIDNDGDLDIYVTRYDSPNQLFMNITRGGVVRFVESAEDYGIDLETGSIGAAFIDFDKDGDLDLHLQTYHLEPAEGRPADPSIESLDGQRRVAPPMDRSFFPYEDGAGNLSIAEKPLADQLFVNTGKLKFEPVDLLDSLPGYTVSSVWWDLDQDLFPDLYSGNDSQGPDFLLLNREGRQISSVARQSLPYTPWLSRGGAAADFNNDLLIDILATGSAPRTHLDRLAWGEPFRQDIFRMSNTGGAMQMPRNALFANSGTTRFAEIARLAGIAHTGATWAVKAADYDGDGLTDLFLTTGEARDRSALSSAALSGEALVGKTRWDILADVPARREADLAYRNLGNWRFEEVGAAWGLDHVGMSYAAGHGDLDGDGDLDLVVCPLGEPVRLYRNHSQIPRAVIALEGTRTNRYGLGSELLYRTDGKTRMRQLFPHSGYKSSDEAAFFVNTSSEPIEKITIRWPASGAIETLPNLEPGYRYTIREAASTSTPLTRERPPQLLFLPSTSLAGAGTEEITFNDYAVQAFLPPGLSGAGPALAGSDLDGDRFAELVFGGSRGNATQLIAKNDAHGSSDDAFLAEIDSEDGAILFFDADGDTDLDLFVGSGGIESGRGESALLGDRLYLSDGQGGFTIAEDALPESLENTGAAAAADFDRDGDVDLFIAARFEIGNYPGPGRSRLLENDGEGVFTDITPAALAAAGPIQSAIWSDVDNDADLDLLLAGHWGPIQLWKNESSTLVDATAPAGLATLTGLWNAITGRDIDNDGDIDYLVTNEGLNTGLTAPASLYSGDYLGLGVDLLLETITAEGTTYPRLGWLDFAEAKPALLEEATSPKQFVEESLPRYFSGTALASLKKWTAQELAHGILVNDGTGRFRFSPLPRIAQISQGYGAVLTDIDFDGLADIYLVQNRAASTIRRPEPDNAGLGQILLGTGNPETPFLPVRADESGIVLPLAGRALIATDLNNDDRVDFIASVRDADPAVYVNQIDTDDRLPLRVPLAKRGKDPAGARVTVEIPDFPTQTAEYYAGDGFLSQSPPELFFGAPKAPKGRAVVTIRWADGSDTRRTISFR